MGKTYCLDSETFLKCESRAVRTTWCYQKNDRHAYRVTPNNDVSRGCRIKLIDVDLVTTRPGLNSNGHEKQILPLVSPRKILKLLFPLKQVVVSRTQRTEAGRSVAKFLDTS